MSAEWKPIIHECRNHVPIIEGVNHLGADLLVSSDGLIVTNAHVVDGKGPLLVSLHDGTRAKGVMIHRHERADLAIVRAAIHTREYFPLQDRLAHGYDAGDEVLAIGHPRGPHFTSTRGRAGGIRRRRPAGCARSMQPLVSGRLVHPGGHLGLGRATFHVQSPLGFRRTSRDDSARPPDSGGEDRTAGRVDHRQACRARSAIP